MNKEIKKAIEEDNLVLFVGAGMSMPLGFPDWKNLIKEILQKLKVDFDKKIPIAFDHYIDNIDNLDLFEILDELELKKVNKEVKNILYQEISKIKLEQKDLNRHKKLWSISNKIITSNYDKALDIAKPQQVEVFENENTFQQSKSIKGSPFLYKIHGDITDAPKCVLFSSDYKTLYSDENPNVFTLRNFLMNKTILFIGFSLEDPFVLNQIKFLQNLYSSADFKHYVISTSNKFYNELNIESLKVDDWGKSFDNLLDEFIDVKSNNIQKTSISKNDIEVNLDSLEDLSLAKKIFKSKFDEYKKAPELEQKDIFKEICQIRNKISELESIERDLDFNLLIPKHKEVELENLFNDLINSEKLSKTNIQLIDEIRDLNSDKYLWYHRSVIVSALACSVLNFKKLDPKKIDFLIDFTNDSETKVWEKSITYLFIVLNHLGNKWIRYDGLRKKLERLKNHKEIQSSLRNIIVIIQFEMSNLSFIDEKIFENDYFKDNVFNYFLPFYKGNASIDLLYEKQNIDDVEGFIEFLFHIPIPDAAKYLLCNSSVNQDTEDQQNSKKEFREQFLQTLDFHKRFEPFLNHINTFLNFYKNFPTSKEVLPKKITITNSNNLKKHLLNDIENYSFLAREHLMKKEWSQAITNYERVLNFDENEKDTMVNLATCYDNTKKSTDEKLIFRKKIEKTLPKNDGNLYKISIYYNILKKYNLSFDYINKAIKLNKNNAKYFLRRGRILYNQEKFLDSIEDYKKALKIGVDDKSILYSDIADSYFGMGSNKEAIKKFKKAIKINFKNISALNGLANCYRKDKKFAKAFTFIEKALKLEKKDGALIGTKAAIYSEQGNNEKFYYFFEKALQNNATANMLFGDVKIRYQNEVKFKDILRRYNQEDLI
jgi:tetratricopeptide (TPR) repeat protein/NAD-dependent SIR2 family protein deacetylase